MHRGDGGRTLRGARCLIPIFVLSARTPRCSKGCVATSMLCASETTIQQRLCLLWWAVCHNFECLLLTGTRSSLWNALLFMCLALCVRLKGAYPKATSALQKVDEGRYPRNPRLQKQLPGRSCTIIKKIGKRHTIYVQLTHATP